MEEMMQKTSIQLPESTAEVPQNQAAVVSPHLSREVLPLWGALTAPVLGWLWFHVFALGFRWTGETLVMCSPGALIFLAALVLWAEGILAAGRRRGKITGTRTLKEFPKESFFWLACCLCAAIGCMNGRGRAWCPYGVSEMVNAAMPALALHGFAVYWILCRTGKRYDGETGVFLPLDGIRGFLFYPLAGFFDGLCLVVERVLRGIKALVSGRGKRDGKSLWLGLLLLVLLLPIFLLAGHLLGLADESFGSLWAGLGRWFRFQWSLSELESEELFCFLVGLPVAAYLFGLVSSCLRRVEENSGEKALIAAERLRFAPAKAVAFALGAFSVLYLVFFGAQATTLFSAFWGRVPGEQTLAQYARSGFFQLCAVSALNFAVLAAAAKLGRVPLRQHKGLKAGAGVLMGENLLLCLSAGSKLVLYIARFGFTPLRLQSFWAVLVLAVGCFLALATLRKPMKAVRPWIWFAAGSFALLCLY